MGSRYILPASEHLLEEEVDFDLRLRGQTVDRRETLDDKKRFLRRLLLNEKKSKSVCEGKHLFKDEVFCIEKNVKAIEDALNKRFDHALVSRLRHYLIRAHTAVTKDEIEKKDQEKICSQIEQILTGCGQKLQEEAGLEDSEVEQEKKEQDEEKNKDGKDKDTKDRVEAEWKEFQLWKLKHNKSKQDRFGESSSSTGSSSDESDRPPKSCKSRKSRQNHGRKEEKEKRRDQGRSPKCVKNRKTGNHDDEWETEESSNERPPKSSKSRKSQEKSSRDNKGNTKGDKRSSESTRSRKSGKDDSFRGKGGRKSRGRNNSSANSSDRSRNGKSKESSDSKSSSEEGFKRKSRRKQNKVTHGRGHRRYASSSTEQEKPRYRKSRVENWDLNFSGDSRSIQVEDFLNRIQTLARHEGVSKDELLMNIHRRLKGEAYDWWFTRESHLTSWKKFENEIRFRYGNPNRDRGIRAQIRELKQRKGETFIAYVTEVEKLNQCLQRPFSSRTLFELIWENMRPYYRSRLSVVDIDDLEDLIEINHKIDANDPSFFKASTSNRNELHHLDVEDSGSDCSEEAPVVNNLSTNTGGIRKTGSNNIQPNKSQQQKTPQRQQQQQQHQQVINRPAIACWNCRKTGHTWRECRGAKQIFCYACGNPGKTTRNCENNHPSFSQRRTQNFERSTN